MVEQPMEPGLRNFDEHSITEAVLDRVGQAAEPRIRQISEAVVRHLHALIREVEPTQAEWEGHPIDRPYAVLRYDFVLADTRSGSPAQRANRDIG